MPSTYTFPKPLYISFTNYMQTALEMFGKICCRGMHRNLDISFQNSRA